MRFARLLAVICVLLSIVGSRSETSARETPLPQTPRDEQALQTNPASGGPLLTRLDTIGGRVRALAVDHTHLYLSEGFRLTVVDIARPGQPRRLGTVRLPLYARSLEIAGDYVYVLDYNNNVHSVDVRDPEHPALLWSASRDLVVAAIQVVGSQAYLLHSNGVLTILDVSTAAHPTQATITVLDKAYDLEVSDNIAYVSTDTGIVILDLRAPSVPLGTYTNVHPDVSLHLDGRTLYAFRYGMLDMLHIERPGVLTPLSSLPVPARDVHVVGEQLFVQVQRSVMVVDISDLARPMVQGYCQAPYDVTAMAITSTHAFVALDFRGWTTLDTRTCQGIALRSTGWVFGHAESVAVTGGLAYVATGQTGLVVYDVTDPNRPQERGRFDVFPASDITIRGEHAYLVHPSLGLRVLSLRDPLRPVELAHLSEVRGQHISVNGSFAYVAAGSNGLQIVDISTPTKLRLVGHLTDIVANDVQVVDGIGYIAADGEGLRTIDVHDPAAPRPLSHLRTPGLAMGIDVADGRAYIADYYAGLRIVDVRVPARPQPLGYVDTRDSASGVQVVGTQAYVTDNHAGLQLVNIADPAFPRLEQTYRDELESNIWISDVQVVGNIAYVADSDNGLQLFDLNTPRGPVIPPPAPASGTATQIISDARYLYVAMAGQLQLFERLTNGTLLARGSYRLPLGGSGQLTIHGTKLYVANIIGLSIIDVADPDHPVLIGSFQGNGFVEGVFVANDRAYLTGYQKGFEIVDVRDPTAPSLLSRLDTVYEGVTHVVGQRAYIAALNYLWTIDVTDVTQPVVRDMQRLGGAPQRMDVVGDRLSIANPLRVFDLSVPDQPRFMGQYDGCRSSAMHIIGTLVYLGCTNGEVQIVDMADPIRPMILAVHRTQLTYATVDYGDLVLADGQLYLAWQDEGIDIMHVATEQLPTSATITPAGGTLASPDGSVQLTFPAGAVTSNTLISYTEMVLLPGELPSAQEPLRTFAIAGREADGTPITQFEQPYTIVIDVPQRVSTTAGLNLIRWNGGIPEALFPCAGCAIDQTQQKILVQTNWATTFTLVTRGTHTLALPFLQR